MLDGENYLNGKFPQGIALVEYFLKGVAQLRHLAQTESLTLLLLKGRTYIR